EVIARWATCTPGGNLALLSAADGVGGGASGGSAGSAGSAWTLCGSEAREIRIGSPDVAARPDIGNVAGSDAAPWAIRGDSVVQLGADRTPIRTVRIGTPGALAVDGSTVWVLDVGHDSVVSIGA